MNWKNYGGDDGLQMMFGHFALAAVAAVWVIGLPWFLLAGWSLWFLVGLSVPGLVLAFFMLIMPMFDKY